ncbi:MAG: FAD-dependent oxidoreductase [Candidatus Kerfeldbacteria bacterium]|nr:FAD-dependent oxidoreductase [Candidatus Kerfeldbacteria bacterium]
MKTHLCKQVVILGGGFAGLAAALRLARTPGFRREFNVILIDRNCYHLYHGLLYEVATATYNIRPADLEYLEGGVCIRLKSLGALVTKAQVDFIQAQVTGVDQSRQRILLAGQPEVPYDQLIVALGAEPSFFGIPGMAEHALTLQTIPDALKIRERVASMLAVTDRSQRIVIGGGGFTGVELAGELMNMLRAEARRQPGRKGSVSLTVVEAGPGLLTPLGVDFGRRAQQRLRSLGVTFEFGQPIIEATLDALKLKDGKSIPFELLIWTGGIAANSLIGHFGIPLAGRGQAAVEASLRVQGRENIWAAGDGAAITDPTTGRLVPQTAPQAVAAGTQVADNLVRSLRGQPLLPFRPAARGFVIPIGGTFALAQRRYGIIGGWLGWLMRKATDWAYFRSIMSFRNAWKVFVRGGRVYLRND